MNRMKWSIIGAGYISNLFCENLLDRNDSKIYSISSNNLDKLNNFGDKFKIAKNFRFNNYSEVLNLDSDVVYIGLINSLHKKLIHDLAANKKNILVEKPCFLNVKDFDDTIEIVKNNNILFVESMMNLHHPQTIEIFKIINSGEIGSLKNFKHFYGFDIRERFFKYFKKKINFYNRFTNPELGGGAINDLGCYGVSFANKLAKINGSGKVKKLKKKLKIGKTRVDERAEINILYDNNFEVTLGVSLIKNIGCEAIIEGTNGKIIIPNLVKPKENFKLYIKNKTYKELNFNSKNLYSYISNDVERYVQNGLKEADNYGLKFSEIRENLYLMDRWKD